MQLTCTKCKKTKHKRKFYSGERQCKECIKARSAARNVKTETRRRRHLNKYKVSCGCAYCNYNESAVALDFHHVDESTKVREVPKMLTCKLSKLMNEVRKCIVVCANCHRRLHNGEL